MTATLDPATAAVACTLTVPVAALREALARVTRVLKAGSPLPILTCVRLVHTGDALTLDATNIDVQVRTTVALDGALSFAESSAVRLAIPAASLSSALQHASAETATLTLIGGGAPRAEIRVGRARYQIAGRDADEMPTLRGLDDITDDVSGRFPAGLLQRAVRRVQHAASTHESRLVMNSVHLEPHDGALEVIALDVPQFARVRLPGLTGLADALAGGAIVPTTAADLIGRAFDADELLGVRLADQVLRVASSRTVVVARLVQGPYPAWRRFARASSRVTVAVEREALLRAVERVAFAAVDTKGWRPVGLAFSDADGGTCRVWAASQDGSAVDIVACEVPAGCALTVGINAAPFRDALGKTHSGTTVRLGMEGPRQNIQITDPDDAEVLAIVSPINTPSIPDEPASPEGA